MVIGLITVLIAMLLPVLRKVREQANIVVCASNERQIYHALLLYAQNNEDWLPVPGCFGQPVLPNLMFQQLNSGVYDYSNGVLWPYLARDPATRQKLFICPSDGPDRPTVIDISNPTNVGSAPQRNFTYNFNGQLIGTATDTLVQTDRGLAPGLTGMRLTRIIHPYDKLLVLESLYPRDCTQSLLATWIVSPQQPVSLLGNGHGGLANQCFADGHVELFDPAAMKDPRLISHYSFLDARGSGYVP